MGEKIIRLEDQEQHKEDHFESDFSLDDKVDEDTGILENIASSLILPWMEDYDKKEGKTEYLPSLLSDPNYPVIPILISSSGFPPGVMGWYLPSTHQRAVRGDLPLEGVYSLAEVAAHEEGHSNGLRNEKRTDDYATRRSGQIIEGPYREQKSNRYRRTA